MIPWVRFDDHKTADGQTDFNSLRAAQLANGEICTRCGDSITWPSGHPSECSGCLKLNHAAELDHACLVRCPWCSHTHKPDETGDYESYTNGDHDIACPDCGKIFSVRTRVYYNFTSPPLKTTDNHDEEEDD